MMGEPDCECLECRIVRECDAATAAADAREAEIDRYGYGRPPGHKSGPVVGLAEFVPGSEPVTLADPAAAYNFHIGQPVELSWGAGGVRRATRGEVLKRRILARVHIWTRWWRPRSVVAAVDTRDGSIVLAVERWSWRRWRWERA